MTGFGVGSALLGGGRIAVEVRTVNGRFLDVRVRLPYELGDLSSMVESEARRRLSRGRCDIAARAEGSALCAPVVDKERARAAYQALVELRDELSPGADVPFSMLSAVPDLFAPSQTSSSKPAEDALKSALGAALDDLDLMRKKEGRAIADDLAQRLATVRRLLDGIAARAPELLDSQAQKFQERLARISGNIGDDLPVDPARFEQELVLLLERSDISEESVRLASHAEQMTAYLDGDEPCGRRLDFLLQEMAREINTIGAKSQDLRILHLVIEFKAEIERMREQVQNVE